MFGHRPDPNNFAGAEARRESGNDRRNRLARLGDKPLGRLALETLVKVAVIFAVAGTLFWLLSRMRGY